MEKRLRAALASALLLLLLSLPQPAAAHSEEPRLEITPEALNPGMALQIRGVGFELEEQVALVLAGGAGQIPLEPAVADEEGIFVLLITVPADLSEGTYYVHGTTDDHEVDSPPFTVRGPVVAENEAGAPRQEDDGLLAPMPTYAPGVSVTALPTARDHAEPEIEETIMFVVIAVLAGAAIWMALALRGRRGR